MWHILLFRVEVLACIFRLEPEQVLWYSLTFSVAQNRPTCAVEQETLNFPID